jgi:hypothetical protein
MFYLMLWFVMMCFGFDPITAGLFCVVAYFVFDEDGNI